MSGDEADPLDDIFVDSEEMDRELLADILRPYVTIGDAGNQLYTTDAYDDLTSKEKILVALTAQRAMLERDVADSAVLGPSELSDISRVKVGTVKPAVRDLADEGLIQDDEDGYSVSAPLLQRVESYLEDND